MGSWEFFYFLGRIKCWFCHCWRMALPFPLDFVKFTSSFFNSFDKNILYRNIFLLCIPTYYLVHIHNVNVFLLRIDLSKTLSRYTIGTYFHCISQQIWSIHIRNIFLSCMLASFIQCKHIFIIIKGCDFTKCNGNTFPL